VIALIDYRAGNLTSVKKALATIGADVFVPVRPEDMSGANAIIVPGVGHFVQQDASLVVRVRSYGADAVSKEIVEDRAYMAKIKLDLEAAGAEQVAFSPLGDAALPAGTQVMTVWVDSGAYNLDYISLTPEALAFVARLDGRMDKIDESVIDGEWSW
jgi:hypothetical protein